MLRDTISKHKERGGMTETVTVSCPFCHQSMMAECTRDIANSRDLRRDLAIELCSCPAAEEEAKRKDKIERLDKELNNAIGENSPHPVDTEVYEVIRENAKLVALKKLHRTSVWIEKNEKIVITRDADGITNINREVRKVKSVSI